MTGTRKRHPVATGGEIARWTSEHHSDGNANLAVLDAVWDTADPGVPVLVCSRVPSGPVWPFYGGGDGGSDPAAAGAVFGADPSPWQARILLAASVLADRAKPSVALRQWLDASASYR